jgi:hypothetical protein
MKDGTTHIKTTDEMTEETPNFRGIVTQSNLMTTVEGAQINQLEVGGWKFSRGWLAIYDKKREFGETHAEAFKKMEARIGKG